MSELNCVKCGGAASYRYESLAGTYVTGFCQQYPACDETVGDDDDGAAEFGLIADNNIEPA